MQWYIQNYTDSIEYHLHFVFSFPNSALVIWSKTVCLNWGTVKSTSASACQRECVCKWTCRCLWSSTCQHEWLNVWIVSCETLLNIHVIWRYSMCWPTTVFVTITSTHQNHTQSSSFPIVSSIVPRRLVCLSNRCTNSRKIKLRTTDGTSDWDYWIGWDRIWRLACWCPDLRWRAMHESNTDQHVHPRSRFSSTSPLAFLDILTLPPKNTAVPTLRFVQS